MRRNVVLVDGRCRRTVRKNRRNERRLVQIVVERVRIDLVAGAIIEHQVRAHAPAVFCVTRYACVAMRVVVRARDAFAVLVAERRVDERLVDDVGGVPRCRRYDVELREPVHEVRHLDAVVHDVRAATNEMVAHRIVEIVAKLIETFEGRLRRDAVRPSDKQAIVGEDANAFQSRDGNRLRRGIRAQHAILEVREGRAEAVGQL